MKKQLLVHSAVQCCKSFLPDSSSRKIILADDLEQQMSEAVVAALSKFGFA
jgi:hypothetical protein